MSDTSLNAVQLEQYETSSVSRIVWNGASLIINYIQSWQKDQRETANAQANPKDLKRTWEKEPSNTPSIFESLSASNWIAENQHYYYTCIENSARLVNTIYRLLRSAKDQLHFLFHQLHTLKESLNLLNEAFPL